MLLSSFTCHYSFSVILGVDLTTIDVLGLNVSLGSNGQHLADLRKTAAFGLLVIHGTYRSMRRRGYNSREEVFS